MLLPKQIEGFLLNRVVKQRLQASMIRAQHSQFVNYLLSLWSWRDNAGCRNHSRPKF